MIGRNLNHPSITQNLSRIRTQQEHMIRHLCFSNVMSSPTFNLIMFVVRTIWANSTSGTCVEFKKLCLLHLFHWKREASRMTQSWHFPYWPTSPFPTINAWSSHVFVAYVDFLRSHAKTSPKHEISSYFPSFTTSRLPYLLLSFAGVYAYLLVGIQQQISTPKPVSPTNQLPQRHAASCTSGSSSFCISKTWLRPLFANQVWSEN